MDSELAKLIAEFERGATGEITKTQTTHLDVICARPQASSSKAAYRIHFRGKRDYFLQKGQISSLALLAEHPLLLEYAEAHKDIYLSSAVPDKRKFISALEDAARIKFGGWRSLERYINPRMGLSELLDESFGLLMSAPASFAEVVVDVAGRNGVGLNVLPGVGARGRPQVLLMDGYYVVADSFYAGALAESPPDDAVQPGAS